MFDIGFAELMLLAIIGLLVLGPQRLPRAARMVGLWLRKAKASWYSVKSEMERELADEDLKRTLKSTTDEFRETSRELESLARQDALAADERASGTARKTSRRIADSDATTKPAAMPAPTPERDERDAT